MGKKIDLSQFQKKEIKKPDFQNKAHDQSTFKANDVSNQDDVMMKDGVNDEKENYVKTRKRINTKNLYDDQIAQLWAEINTLKKDLLQNRPHDEISIPPTTIPPMIFQDLVTVLDEVWTRYIKWGYGPKSLKVKKIAEYFKISLEDPALLLKEKAEKHHPRNSKKKTKLQE